MRELYDVKMLETWGSARRGQRQIGMLGRALRFTDDGLENEANEQHRPALLKGHGSCNEVDLPEGTPQWTML